MTTPKQALTVSFEASMAAFDRRWWNAMAQGLSPFMRWEWLELLERSGAVCPATGWQPAHCAMRRDGELVAAAPLYLKGHSQGEFIYDQFWADVARRMNLPYYPKLVAASPFTPVQGYRILTAPEFSPVFAAQAMLHATDRLSAANALTGLHVLFADEHFADALEDLGFMAWEHQGFLWVNQGYACFDDFLELFRAGQRRNIRKERERLAASGVRVEVVPGEDAPESWFALMHSYYERTNDKFGEWGCKYLPERFFLELASCFRQHLAFSAAFEGGDPEPVGLALLAHGDGGLYGRYWGAAREIPFMHFELCYYAPIQWAIAKGLSFFDPGMGGEHKPRRGFTSRVTRSLHRFQDPAMARVFAGNIAQVNAVTRDYIDELDSLNAFRRGPSGG